MIHRTRGALMILCWAAGVPLFLSASTELPLDNIQNRNEILQERKGMDCGGIYKQTQLKLDATLKILDKFQLTTSVKPEQLVELTTITAGLGQKRREFCEYYKRTPEWNKEEYFRAYGDMEKQNSDIDKMLQAIVEQARAQKGGAKMAAKLAPPSLETVPVVAGDTFETLAAKLETQITTTPVFPEPSPNGRPFQGSSLIRVANVLLAIAAGVAGGLGAFGGLRYTGFLRK